MNIFLERELRPHFKKKGLIDFFDYHLYPVLRKRNMEKVLIELKQQTYTIYTRHIFGDVPPTDEDLQPHFMYRISSNYRAYLRWHYQIDGLELSLDDQLMIKRTVSAQSKHILVKDLVVERTLDKEFPTIGVMIDRKESLFLRLVPIKNIFKNYYNEFFKPDH